MMKKLQCAIDCAELAVTQASMAYYANEGTPQDVDNLQAWNQAKLDRTQAYINYNLQAWNNSTAGRPQGPTQA
jgi:hypothetical protein